MIHLLQVHTVDINDLKSYTAIMHQVMG